MDLGKLAKLIVVIVLIVFAFRFAKQHLSTPGAGSPAASGGSGCAAAAGRASERWGSGIGRFVNPPYDLDAWGRFHDDVGSAIAEARRACGCASESCRTAGAALTDLEALVSELDTAIRNGSPVPQDVVQRQERIDSAIDEAAALERDGK